MNLLILGNGKGSFEMRGKQLGAALGARVSTDPTEADWRWASVVVLVKRYGAQFAGQAHQYGLPIVWDALDFWGQPTQNGLSEAVARANLTRQIELIRPSLVIGATEAMAEAAGGAYLPHHCWEGLTPTPAREVVQTVAYQGGEVFLGKWRQLVERACAARGWRFVVNPVDLRDADILVAFRDGQWDGWMCREWKSGVKLGNAMAAGRPILTQPSAAFREMSPAGSMVDEHGLDVALDRWSDYDSRLAAFERSHAGAYALDQVAARYRLILQEAMATCAA